MSVNDNAHPNFFQALIWALSLPLPERHLRVLLALLSFMEGESRRAWPSLKRLTERVVMMKPDTVHMTMAELIECGLLTKVHTDNKGIPKKSAVRIEVGETLAPDSNPLSSILLQEVVRRIEDVTHVERWVLLAMARNYDWAIAASVIDYKRARSEYPWLSRQQWRAALRRLVERGVISNVRRGNRYSMPYYSLPGLAFYIGHRDASSPSSDVTVTHLDPQMSHGDASRIPGSPSSSGVTVTHLDPQMSHGDATRQSYLRHGDASSEDESPIYVRAELPIEQVVVEEEDRDTTTTTTGSSAVALTAEFEAALIQSVIPQRGEKYIPGQHDGQEHRLNPVRRLIRQYAWEGQATVHPTQAARLRDFIESADWITQRWGHVGAIKDLVEMWVETGEDLSQPWEPPPDPEATAPADYIDLVDIRADPEAQRIWDDALGQLQLHVTRPNFETWLKRTIGLETGDGYFIVGTPNTFVAEMLEQRMYSLLSRTLESIVKQEVNVRFTVYLDSAEQEQLRSLT